LCKHGPPERLMDRWFCDISCVPYLVASVFIVSGVSENPFFLRSIKRLSDGDSVFLASIENRDLAIYYLINSVYRGGNVPVYGIFFFFGDSFCVVVYAFSEVHYTVHLNLFLLELEAM
jgi:hypothetical protein